MLRFFSAPQTPEEDFQLFRLTSANIAHILSTATRSSLVILDIDDTVGRVSTSIGLDAWFRFRIQQFIADGHDSSKALENAINLFTLAQLASTTMVPVDIANPIAPLIAELKAKGTKVIGLTARAPVLADKTFELLGTIGVTFSGDILNDATFMLSEKPVKMEKGVIFANGNHKGACLEFAHKHGHITSINTFDHVHFADDSSRNCDHVAESLAALRVKRSTIWHYTFAELHLTFSEEDRARARIQEDHLIARRALLTNGEADAQLGRSPS